MQTSKKNKPTTSYGQGCTEPGSIGNSSIVIIVPPPPPHIPLHVEHVSVPFVDAFALVVDDPFETLYLFCKQRPAAAAILPNTQKHWRIKSNISSLFTDDCNSSTGLSCKKKKKKRNMSCTQQILVRTFDPSSEFLLAFYPLF